MSEPLRIYPYKLPETSRNTEFSSRVQKRLQEALTPKRLLQTVANSLIADWLVSKKWKVEGKRGLLAKVAMVSVLKTSQDWVVGLVNSQRKTVVDIYIDLNKR